MQLDDDPVATAFAREPADRALHAPDDRLGGEHAPGAHAGRAGLGHRVEVALTHPLPRHLDQPEVAHRERLRARAVAAEVRAQLLQHPVAVRLGLHVDEVTDDDAADVAQAELTRDLARGLDVRLGDRLLGILLARVAPRVDVDRDERLGRLDDQVPPTRQLAPPLEEVADLGLDAGLVEQRDIVFVQVHTVDQFGRDPFEVLDDLVVDLTRVDGEAVDLGREEVSDDPARERRLAVQQLGRVADELRLFVDPLPLRDEGLELAGEGLLRHVLADGAHDHTTRVLGEHLLHLLAQPLPLGALADLPADAHSRGERHVDEEAPRHRDLRGHARSLGRDRFLGDLHDEGLSALQDVLDLRWLVTLPTAAAAR